MAQDTAADKPAKVPKFKVVGLTPLKDDTMPVKIKGKVIDLAKASQELLADLYKANFPHVAIDA